MLNARLRATRPTSRRSPHIAPDIRIPAKTKPSVTILGAPAARPCVFPSAVWSLNDTDCAGPPSFVSSPR